MKRNERKCQENEEIERRYKETKEIQNSKKSMQVKLYLNMHVFLITNSLFCVAVWGSTSGAQKKPKPD